MTWTTVAVDRASRRVAVAHGVRQAETASRAYDELYREDGDVNRGSSDPVAGRDG